MSRLAIAAMLLTFVAPRAAHALWPGVSPAVPGYVAATCVDREADSLPRADDSVPRAAKVLAPAPALPVNDDSVPWCLNADDPRCSPIQGGSLPPEVAAQFKLSAAPAFSLPEPRMTLLAVPRPLDVIGGPRAGEHGRLDRPPR
jgi:hypothetical protein